MESITKTRLFAFLGGESFNGFEVEVVVEMEVVEILAVDKKVEHIVSLATHLQASLDPINLSGLEKLGCLELPKQVFFVESLWRAMVKGIQDIAFLMG